MGHTRSVLALTFIGGLVGALARTALAEAWTPEPAEWPWATFAVNIAGAAALGYVLTRVPVQRHDLRGLLGAGFCGALTTFSAFQLELLQMIDDGRLGVAALYASASLAAGMLAVAASGAPHGYEEPA